MITSFDKALTSIKLLRLAVLEHGSDRSQLNENHRGVGGRIALVRQRVLASRI